MTIMTYISTNQTYEKGEFMKRMELEFFTVDENFPFFIQYGKHDEDMFVHTHVDFSELVIVLQGKATHIVDNEKFLINKGDVFVISNNTAHGYESTENFRICNIMYRPETILSVDYDIKKSAGFHALFMLEPYFTKEHRFNSSLKLNPTDFERIKSITDTMLSEYENNEDGHKTILISDFLKLIVILSRLYSLDTITNKPDIINIAKTVSYIENHYTEAISIQNLAEYAHYSPRHFTRIFTETYNTTPIDYITSLRISKACTLLKESRLSISDISLQCGFSDSNYFSRIFKKRMGTSPKLYRQGQF
jgi:AraC-like DNA-binding protein/mannose-6-phosphate isomerase-like protein (cupin superfamily)